MSDALSTERFGEGQFGAGVFGSAIITIGGTSRSTSLATGELQVPKKGVGGHVLGDEFTLILQEREALRFGEVGDDLETIAFYSEDFISGPTWDIEPSVPARWSAELPFDEDLERWQLRNSYLYYAGELLVKGRLYIIDSDDDRSTTQLSGEGYLSDLSRAKPNEWASELELPIEYENMTYADAIEDYFDKYLGYDHEVFRTPPSNVDTEERVQNLRTASQFETATRSAVSSNAPIYFDEERDSLRIAQQAWPMHGFHDSNGLRASANEERFDEVYSRGRAVTLVDGPERTEYPHRARYNFEVKHTIPSIFFGLKVRDTFGPELGPPAFSWYLRFPDGREYDLDYNDVVGFDNEDGGHKVSSLGWTEVGRKGHAELVGRGYDGPDLEPGNYTVICRVTKSKARGDDEDDEFGFKQYRYYINMVAPYDARYYPNDWAEAGWDELNQDEGYLDGPPLAGTNTIEFEEFVDEFNIKEAAAELTMSSIDEGLVKMQVSNDDGKNWFPRGTPSENTPRVRSRFNETWGSTVKVRLRVDAYSEDGPRNANPRYGYSLREIDRLETFIWTDTTEVLESVSLEDDHYSNIQKLHDDSQRVFVSDHTSESEEKIFSLTPGGVLDDMNHVEPINYSRRVDSTNYANAVRVFGERTDGEPYSFVWFSSEQIEEFGEIWAPPEFTGEVGESRVRSIGRPLLRRATSENEPTGTIECMPVRIDVGFGYTNERFDDNVMTLFRVRGSAGERPTCTLSFHPPEALVKALRGIDRDIRTIER